MTARKCGTIQLDFVTPERFGLSYIDSRGGKAGPVMLHRAIFGSIERFVAILLEHHQRALPAWLAPEQVRVLPISDEQAPYARTILEALQRQGLRASLGPGSQTLSRAIGVAGARFSWASLAPVSFGKGDEPVGADDYVVEKRNPNELADLAQPNRQLDVGPGRGRVPSCGEVASVITQNRP